jgi:hypothetical protein
LRRLATILTWATIALEAVIAVGFLAPLRPPWTAVRHLSLLGFCVAAYALAPVSGFAWLLLIMGLAVLQEPAPGVRRAYIATAVLVLVWAELPWARLARALIGG